MKTARRNLLDTMNGRTSLNDEAPLNNLKTSLGNIKSIVGNPLTKSETTIHVDIFFINTALPAIIAPAAIPAPGQVPLSYYLFGLNDSYGAYQKSRFLEPLNLNWGFVEAGFWNYNLFVLTPIVGAIPVGLVLNDGDYILHYAYLGAGNFQAIIRIHCDNVAYSTLVHSLMSDIIYINSVRAIVNVASILQYIHSIKLATLSSLGKLVVDTIDPRLYILPTSPQQTISDIPFKIPCDKRFIFTNSLDFTCQNITYIFFVENIDVLTKRKY